MKEQAIEGYRLSPQQRRLWLLQPDSRAQCAMLITGALDAKALERAILDVIARHEILRTTFHSLSGIRFPVQVVSDAPSLLFNHIVERVDKQHELALVVEQFYREDFVQPIDSWRGALLKASLLEVSQDEHMLFISLPALCADAWSLDNLAQEIGYSYAALEVSDEPFQYADFAEWQNELLDSEEGEEGKLYWLDRNIDELPATVLPYRLKSSATQSFELQTVTGAIEAADVARLEEVSRRYDAPVAAMLMTCWQMLLYRLTGERRIVVNNLCDGRKYDVLHKAIGLFAKWLPVISHFEEDFRFGEVLTSAAESLGEANRWQEYYIAKDDKGTDENGHAHLGFEYEQMPASYSAAGLTFSIHSRYVRADRFILKLSCVRKDHALSVAVHYNADFIERQAVECLVRQYQTLLHNALVNPEARVGELEIIGEPERHQLLREFNESVSAYPKDLCIHQLFEQQVERAPDNVAVVFKDERFTYQELNRKANQLAHCLRSKGVGPDASVAICMDRSADLIVALLGVLKAGGAYVALDITHPKARLSYLLNDTQSKWILTREQVAATLPEYAGELICLDRINDVIEAQETDNPEIITTPDNLAYVAYTSGSTGKPKGVLSYHQSVVNYLSFITKAYSVTDADVVLQIPSLCFDSSVRDIVGPLSAGASIIISDDVEATDPGSLLAKIAAHKVTKILSIVPTMLRSLIDEAFGQGRAYESVQTILASGENLYLSDCKKARQVFGYGLALVNQYGPTECTMTSSYFKVLADDESEGVALVGRPVANCQFYILNDDLAPVAIGVPGNVYISGNGLARGYLNQPDLTAERFIPNPFAETAGARMYKTGDSARYLPGGNIEFLCRSDNQVKIRGVRVELGEIEAALNNHPAIKDAVVVAREDSTGEKFLAAYVVQNRAQTFKPGEMRSFLSEKLPDYMLPQFFVMLDDLPVTRNGKVDRNALPAPDHVRAEQEQPFVAARNQVEAILAGIFAQVLDLNQVGIHDNFFELGGHSLQGTRLIARIREAFSVDIPLRSLFELPTVASLSGCVATLLKGDKLSSDPPLVRVPREGNLPLSFAQQRLWFLHQLDPLSFAYNIARAVRLSGSLDLNALEKTLSEIIRRHESLRTRFATLDGQPVQVIQDARPITLEPISLSHLPESDRLHHASDLAYQESREPFDLEQGNLMRVKLVKLDDDDHVVLMTMHHIISDDWSMAILVKEVAQLYDSYSRGQESQLEELQIQYADYAVWQRGWLSGDVLEKQLEYWKNQLGNNLKPLNLPTDRPRTTDSYRGGAEAVKVSKEVYEAVKRLSQEQGATVFMVLLAALKAMLAKYTGEDEIVVGTDVANRNRVEVENIIGFFVNIMLLRTDLSGNPTFREMVKRVREVAIGAYAHQDLPFDKLIEEFQPVRASANAPLFQVLFVLENAPKVTLELRDLKLSLLGIDNNTAKFDLALILIETEDGISGTWNYSTDLFDASTIRRMSVHLERLLNIIVARPDARLSELDFLSTEEKEERAMQKREHKEANLRKFMNISPKPISVSQENLIETDYLWEGSKFPLVISPAISGVDLVEWANNSREFVEKQLLAHGAILFRGFKEISTAVFERFALAFCPELFGEYGDLPREPIEGKVYSSTPYPSNLPILLHNESSQMNRWPMKIWFMCLQPPLSGGQTPFADSRLILNSLNPLIRDRFADLGILYVRNFTDGLDVSWQQFFRTSDKLQVERFCLDADIAFQWTANNSLRTTKWAPAITSHPKTGDAVFFNQILAHHISCLHKDVKDSLLQLFDEDHLPRNVYYGDGSRIPDDVIDHLIALYDRQAVKFDWRLGDILMLDNMLSAHGRSAFSGNRKVVVTMGEMVGKQQALTNRG